MMRTRPGYQLAVVEKKMTVEKVAIRLNSAGYRAVFVGDKEIGSPLNDYQYPEEIDFVRLKLSAGRELVIASETLPYWGIIDRGRYGFRRGYTEKFSEAGNWSYQSAAKARVITGWVTYSQAIQYRPGELIFAEPDESAFYRQEDGSVTNGWITFPAVRPMGDEWEKHQKIKFVAGIKKESWSLFLGCLIDKFFSEINNKTKMKALVSKARMIAKHKSRIDRVVAGQCFDGASFDQVDIEVGIGERLLFKGKKNKKSIYAVDSPNYGVALYFFSKYSSAKKWANGQISSEEAQALTTARIIHRDGWTAKACQA